MFDSIALLAGEIDRRLGHLDQSYLAAEDIIAALFQVFAFRGLIAQQSNYGRTSKLTSEFYLGARDTLLTQAPDMLLPSYLEIKRNSQPVDIWRWVPAVDSASLEQARGMGQVRCCFEREETGFHIRLSFEPDGIIFRLRYYTDPVIAGGKNDPLPLPERFASMFASEAIINVVPVILARSASLEDEKDQLTVSQLQAISTAVSHAQMDVERWEKLYESEMRSNRNPIGRDRRPILSHGAGYRRTYNG